MAENVNKWSNWASLTKVEGGYEIQYLPPQPDRPNHAVVVRSPALHGPLTFTVGITAHGGLLVNVPYAVDLGDLAVAVALLQREADKVVERVRLG